MVKLEKLKDITTKQIDIYHLIIKNIKSLTTAMM